MAIKCKKTTSKAMKIAAAFSGVESVSFMEPDEDRLVVTGEQVDSVKLTRLLRKRIGDTELVSVGVIEDQKPKKPANKPAAVAVKPNEILAPFWYPCPPPQYVHYIPSYVVHQEPCSIL
ncbi:hypothetical protein E3N88_34571 [Mikania micrantha]|uniref:HMA domain-containing protein n=1 Tax=Mikania micrantha TaxID=192012 RepID=A0A5N6LYR7_9ASTR|nr:hypothetical protein E3N88_34571 [Mikania micrantha]